MSDLTLTPLDVPMGAVTRDGNPPDEQCIRSMDNKKWQRYRILLVTCSG